MLSTATCALAAILLSAPPAPDATQPKTTSPTTTPPAAAPATKPAPRAPATPDPALAPLAFMVGHWQTTLPNGMVSEELWMPVRGKSMLGSFRQTRPDGLPAFFEFTQVVAEKDRVVLRQIHVHGAFDMDEKRKDAMVLKLEKTDGASATFVPADAPEKAHTADLASVTYTLKNADTLQMRIESRPVKDPKNPDAPAKPQVIELAMTRVK